MAENEEKTAEEFFKLAAKQGGRIVSSNDLNVWQLSEARRRRLFFVDPDGFGWAILPWKATTEKDRQRERAYEQRRAEIADAK